ncbi:DUF4352 domain-containing protein [Haloimpatiens sp. FM7330]|uniref:DUF4352 domain-containing protein n=1 Tax=Haloimpatiens sp. FM7330 TaxID=3298610 RepID=UPI00363BD154
MEINNQDEQLRNCMYRLNCKYKEEELLDGYKDRKARIRYKRAILGTIAIFIISLLKTVVYSKSMYFKHVAWYQNCTFWILCALCFMLVFAGNSDKCMWNSRPERTYSIETSTYELYLCEEFLVIFYNITGVKKVIKYNELDMYEVNNYFLLETEYLNGYYISKEKLGEHQTNNVREFLKTKGKVKNLKLPFVFSKFARMPILVEILIIVALLGTLVFKVQMDNKKVASIGEMVVCNNLGITVEEAEHTTYGNSNPIQLFRVNVLLQSFQRNDGKGRKYSPVTFKLVDKDGQEYRWFSISDPNELKTGFLDNEEKTSGDIYFLVPSNEEPEYLIYTSYNRKHKKLTEKILLKKNIEEKNKE